MGHPVVRALYSLFQALAQQQAGPGWEPLGSLQASELREALEALPRQLLCAGGPAGAALWRAAGHAAGASGGVACDVMRAHACTDWRQAEGSTTTSSTTSVLFCASAN